MITDASASAAANVGFVCGGRPDSERLRHESDAGRHRMMDEGPQRRGGLVMTTREDVDDAARCLQPRTRVSQSSDG